MGMSFGHQELIFKFIKDCNFYMFIAKIAGLKMSQLFILKMLGMISLFCTNYIFRFLMASLHISMLFVNILALFWRGDF